MFSLNLDPAYSYMEIVFIGQARDDQAWTLLAQRQDKNWSLVDRASFVVMQELGLVMRSHRTTT